MLISRDRTAKLVLAAAAAGALTALGPGGPAVAGAEPGPSSAGLSMAGTPGHLDLGPADLPETRTRRVLQPGVTLTRITRGSQDQSLFWTLTVLIPSTSTSPDPDAPPQVISDEASAQALAAHLRQQGFDPRVEPVRQPQTADVAAGTLGYRVRVGHYDTQQAAQSAQTQLAGNGDQADVRYTGWDPNPSARGPWHIDVIIIDPQHFTGRLDASYGADLYHRQTPSALARATGATAATNGGFFVLDPAAGAPGDPAGVGVYDGKVLSEPVGHRPALAVQPDARHTTITRPTWTAAARINGAWRTLDGIDRVPGLIRNCGGDRTDSPTYLPLQDITCTDNSELVEFTPEYGEQTPTGPGREVVLNAHHAVVEVRDHRGTALGAGQTSLQGTGTFATLLGHVHVGDVLPIRRRLDGHSTTSPESRLTMINGGPLLLRNGHEHITQRQDGFVHPNQPSFAYGWVIERNPRTLAGVDKHGRTVIVTADGRSTHDLGLSIPEAADVARSLGLRDAINLDGGGSTDMVINGQVISHPSDSTGERAVGDSLLVLPHRVGTP